MRPQQTRLPGAVSGHCSRSDNLAPDAFVFWEPDGQRTVRVGPEQLEVRLPDLPLPINGRDGLEQGPSDSAIGQGLYDYLRRFPGCPHNQAYAELLRDAYPHLLADLAAHAVLLDAKDVEPAYVLRKLTALKILRLLEPNNKGLLHQLGHGFYELALTLTELPRCRRYLLEAMRAALDLHRLDPQDLATLELLAEIDMLFCDYPSAARRWQTILDLAGDVRLVPKAAAQLAICRVRDMPERTRVDDLEDFGQALQLYGGRNYLTALVILERLEEMPEFIEAFPSADFFYLLGMCRMHRDDQAGAIDALDRALTIAPGHLLAREAFDELCS